MPGKALSPKRYTPRLHEQRATKVRLDDDMPEEIQQAWRSVVMHWLETMPGFREQLKLRVSAEQKRRKRKWERIEQETRRQRMRFDDLDPGT